MSCAYYQPPTDQTVLCTVNLLALVMTARVDSATAAQVQRKRKAAQKALPPYSTSTTLAAARENNDSYP
jgi:hypothetical protein